MKIVVPSLDANVLLRAIIRDIPTQSDAVIKLTTQYKKLVLSDIAIIECIFVLNRYYDIPRNDVAKSILLVVTNQKFMCNRLLFTESLELYAAQPSLSIEDCYMATLAKQSGNAPLYTFDKKLAKMSKSAELLV